MFREYQHKRAQTLENISAISANDFSGIKAEAASDKATAFSLMAIDLSKTSLKQFKGKLHFKIKSSDLIFIPWSRMVKV